MLHSKKPKRYDDIRAAAAARQLTVERFPSMRPDVKQYLSDAAALMLAGKSTCVVAHIRVKRGIQRRECEVE